MSNEDKAERITDALKQQIEKVRRSGRANMCNLNAVQYAANEMKLFDLVVYLMERPNRQAYFDYILTGKEPDESEET